MSFSSEAGLAVVNIGGRRNHCDVGFAPGSGRRRSCLSRSDLPDSPGSVELATTRPIDVTAGFCTGPTS